MAAKTSTRHRLVRAVLVKHLLDKGSTAAEVAQMFKITQTYVRKIAGEVATERPTADERAINVQAAAHEPLLRKLGYGFFFRS